MLKLSLKIKLNQTGVLRYEEINGRRGVLNIINVRGGEINFFLTRGGMTYYFGSIFHPFPSHALSLQVMNSQSLTKESILMCISSLKNPLVTPAGRHEQKSCIERSLSL